MIEEDILREWAAAPEKLTNEQKLMLISQLITYQRNATVIYVFPQAFFDAAQNKIGVPQDNAITPERLRGFVLEKTVNADYYFAANSRMMPQDALPQPPNIVPQPLYRARVTADYLTIRDKDGGDGYGKKGRDEIVYVWGIVPQIAGRENRAIITPPDMPQLNIWNEYLERLP